MMSNGRRDSDTQRTISALLEGLVSSYNNKLGCPHFISNFVCGWCEYPFLFRPNTRAIDPFLTCPLTPARASSKVSALRIVLYMSSPQQVQTCLLMLLVEPLLRVSRNQRMACLHTFARHLKTWQRRSVTYLMLGVGE